MIDNERVLETLKSEYAENPLVSARTIEEVLETLIQFTSDDTDEGDFIEKVKSVLRTSEGNARKVASDTAKKVMKEEKPTPKAKKPLKKELSEEEQEVIEDDIPNWVKDLTKNVTEQLAQMQKQLDKNDNERRVEQIKRESIAKVSIYPKNVVDVALDGFDFSIDNAQELFAEKVGRVASSFNVTPEKGSPKDDNPDFSGLERRLRDKGILKD